MSNWLNFGKTQLKAGFQQEGNICEGGNCEHLQKGDQSFGFTAENDSFGSEYYLYCETCYNQFLLDRKNELVICHDCMEDVPRNTTVTHIPYYVDEEPRAKWAKIICNDCRVKPRHLVRLDADEEERSHDQQNQNDWSGSSLLEDDTEDPGDYVAGEIDRLTQLDDDNLSRIEDGFENRRRSLSGLFDPGVKITGTPSPLHTDRASAALLSNLDPESSCKPTGKLIILFPRDEGKSSGLKSIVVKPKTMVLSEETLSFIKNGPNQ